MRLPSQSLNISLCGLVAVASLLIATSPAIGYKIWPFPGIHEAITLLAEQCALEAAPAPPRDCRRFAALIGPLSARRDSATYDNVQIAVRWPDDPGRQAGSAGTLNLGFNLLAVCDRITRNEPTLDTAGVLCSSHYGRLQFVHAMAATAAEEANPAATRAKILAWADLTYRLAIGNVSPRLGLCAYFQDHSPALANAFALDHGEHCDRTSPDYWTFATLFNWRCRNPASMRDCDQLLGPETRDVLAVSTAQGALLHVIQDSYSQSHAARGPALPNGYEARVDCRLPTRFYTYRGQHDHDQGDQVPRYDDNCRSGAEADDVITATAMALYYVRRRADPAELGRYLEDRVFGHP